MQSPPPLIFPQVASELCVFVRPLLPAGVVVEPGRFDFSAFPSGTRHVSIERAGGSRTRFLDTALVLVEARGAHDDDAHNLADLTRAYLWTAPHYIDGVVGVREAAGLARFTDADTTESFYRFSLSIKSRGKRP